MILLTEQVVLNCRDHIWYRRVVTEGQSLNIGGILKIEGS